MPEMPDYLFKYHKRGKHEVVYGIANQESGSTAYYQYINTDGFWYMMRSVQTSTVTVYTYSAPVSIATTTLAAGWTGRADLVYTTFNLAFV
jgi:hypothetical protein